MKITEEKTYSRLNYKDSKSFSNQKRDFNNKQAFNGGISEIAFDVLDKTFAVLDKDPMIQVSAVDTISTNIPRTLVDLKTGLAAAFETCRREFSGLFVNCLMPGLVVKGIAALLPKPGDLRQTGVVGSWANGDNIEKLKEVYKQSQSSAASDTTREYVQRALGSIEGLSGKNWVKFSDKANTPEFIDAVEKITLAVSKNGKERSNLLKNAQEQIVKVTKAENVLKFNDKPQSNLQETLRDITDLGSKFNFIKDKTVKNLTSNAEGAVDNSAVTQKVFSYIDDYSDSLKRFVNKKSIIGLIVVIGIAVSIQGINRAITRKQFNAEGAPIYKDFGKKDTTQKMTEEERKKFNAKKLVAALGMYSLAALSMMKKPTIGMFQFSGIFPTMDQCRWIASSTFASRLVGAEDDNELRESFVRDVASFSGLYFLGDYVKKGVASGLEAFSKTKKGAELLGENVVLLNRKKDIAKPLVEATDSFGKKVTSQIGYRAKQFGNWIKNTDLKTASEVSSTKVRNLRNLCRVADIAFSVLMLGILLPKYNRKVTEKKVAAAKLAEEKKKQAMFNFESIQDANTPSVFKNI